MTRLTRRTVLTSMALMPVLPRLLIESANATTRRGTHDGNVVVLIRMMGGNDGLNTVIPVRDDRYYRARPTVAIPRAQSIALHGGDLGLHPSLAPFHDLMERGQAGIVLGVGYPKPSRNHIRSTEIWESAVLDGTADRSGWLGRYVESECACERHRAPSLALGSESGGALVMKSGSAPSVANPAQQLALQSTEIAQGPQNAAFAQLARAQKTLANTSEQLRRSQKGSGKRFEYPDTEFGQALRYAGDMIETQSPTRIYALSVGSFAKNAASFDTHFEQLDKHKLLYSELSGALHAFATHLRATGDFSRVLALTYSDFGRLLVENKTGGTDHGDASVLFYSGGRVVPGIRGAAPDLSRVTDGGLDYTVDFRSIYANVRRAWLHAPADPLLAQPELTIVRETGSAA